MNPLLIAALLYTLDGGQGNLQVPNMPFYHMNACNYMVILTPENRTYGVNTVNITLLTDATSCQYRINDNAWNIWDCTEERVTYPFGHNILYVMDASGSCIDIVEYTNLGNSGRRYFDPSINIFAVAVSILIIPPLLLYAMLRRKKRSRNS